MADADLKAKPSTIQGLSKVQLSWSTVSSPAKIEALKLLISILGSRYFCFIKFSAFSRDSSSLLQEEIKIETEVSKIDVAKIFIDFIFLKV
jgi:hypothetical protein